MSILAMADYRRSSGPGLRRHRQQDPAPPPSPPAHHQRPPAWPCFAVPGTAAATGKVEALIGQPIASVTQARDHHEPGRVACWVTCLVCEARYKGEHGQDGRPRFEGGTIDARVRADGIGWRPVAVACRCPAGLASGAPPATDRQYRVAVRFRKQRQMRGLLALSDDLLFSFLVVPRTPIYHQNWESCVQRMCADGLDAHSAWRRAIIVCDWDWQARNHA